METCCPFKNTSRETFIKDSSAKMATTNQVLFSFQYGEGYVPPAPAEEPRVQLEHICYSL